MKTYYNQNGKGRDAERFTALQNSTQATFKYTLKKDVIFYYFLFFNFFYFKICVVLKITFFGPVNNDTNTINRE